MKTGKLSKIIFIFLLVGMSSFAQQDLTIYHMNSIPQSNYSNPALIPQPRFHISFLPMLSSIYLSFGHTGFNAHHLLSTTPDDSVTFNLEKFVKSLAKYNHILFNTSLEILSFGFQFKKKHYVNFAFNHKFNSRITYAEDFIRFLYAGNGSYLDERLEFSRMGFNMLHYNELMLGYALKWDDKWTFGAHLKLLQGLSNIWFKRSDITLLTESDLFFITATSNIEVNASLPPSVWEDDTTNQETEFSVGDYFFNMKNKGVALDLGATYKLNDKLTLSASVIDLGFIRFASPGTRQFKSTNTDASFTFEGVDITTFLSDTTGDKIQMLLDSIVDIFKIDTIIKKYTYYLNTHAYIGGTYALTKQDYIHGLVRLHFFARSIHPALTISYRRTIGHWFATTLSYSMVNRKLFNLGIGFSINGGPLQLYFLTDNLISPLVYNKYYWSENDQVQSLMLPRNLKYLNVHFGLNLVFGYRPPKEVVPIF